MGFNIQIRLLSYLWTLSFDSSVEQQVSLEENIMAQLIQAKGMRGPLAVPEVSDEDLDNQEKSYTSRVGF